MYNANDIEVITSTPGRQTDGDLNNRENEKLDNVPVMQNENNVNTAANNKKSSKCKFVAIGAVFVSLILVVVLVISLRCKIFGCPCKGENCGKCEGISCDKCNGEGCIPCDGKSCDECNGEGCVDPCKGKYCSVCNGEGCIPCDGENCGGCVGPCCEVGVGFCNYVGIKYTISEFRSYNVVQCATEKKVVENATVINQDNTNNPEHEKYIAYTLDIRKPSEDAKHLYSEVIDTLITIEIEGSENESPKKVNPEDLKNIHLPICVFTHTESNVILSISCKDPLSEEDMRKLKKIFENLRPTMIENEFFKIEPEDRENDSKYYKKYFIGECSTGDYSIAGSNCTELQEIVVSKEEKLISFKKTITSNITSNDTQHETNVIYEVSDSTQEGDSQKKEKIISLYENLKQYFKVYETLTNEEIKKNFETIKNRRRRRNLIEYQPILNPNTDIGKEENFFNITDDGRTINLSVSNFIGLNSISSYTEGKAKIGSIFGYKDETFSKYTENSNLKEIFNALINLSKASNYLATELNNAILPELYKIIDEITERISLLSDELKEITILSIFKDPLTVNHPKELTGDIIIEINKINDRLISMLSIEQDGVKNLKDNLKDSISNFVAECHSAMELVFSSLSTASNSLNQSITNNITRFEIYYLNNTYEDFREKIKLAKGILDQYYTGEKKYVEDKVKEILDNFESKSKSDIESANNILDYLIEKLEGGELSIENYNNESTEFKNAINKLKDIKINLEKNIENIRRNIYSGIQYEDSGFFESNTLIEENRNKYGNIINQAETVANKLDKNEYSDKNFDGIMIYLREGFTDILKKISESKRNDYPLKENVLNEYSNKFNSINNTIKDKTQGIINFLTKENEEYTQKQKEAINNFKSNQNNLNNLIFEIHDLLSGYKITNLDTTYKVMYQSMYEKIDNIMDKEFNLGKLYLEDFFSLKDTPLYTSTFKKKYELFISALNNLKEYNNGEMKRILQAKYFYMVGRIQALIRGMQENNYIRELSEYEDLAFLRDYIEIIDSLDFSLEEKISKKIYIEKYKTKITDISSDNDVSINTYINNLKELKKKIVFLDPDHISIQNFDICIDHPYISCQSMKTYWQYCITTSYQDCYNTLHSTNYNELILSPSDEMDSIITKFDSLLNDFITTLEMKISTFTQLLNSLTSEIIDLGNDITNSKDYLNEIKDSLNSILSDNFGKKLVFASFSYYKGLVDEKFNTGLNNIFDLLFKLFNDTLTKTKNNRNNYINAAYEFEMILRQYENLYYTNITEDYLYTVVEQNKNEMNYTISFYYDYLKKVIRESYIHIKENIPTNIYGITTLHDNRTKQIDEVFNALLSQIESSNKDALNSDSQRKICETTISNFFSLNQIVEKHKNTARANLTSIIDKVVEVTKLTWLPSQRHYVAGKIFEENRESGREIKSLYNEINNDAYVETKSESFKELLNQFWVFDETEFLNSIQRNISNSKANIKKKYTVSLEKEFKEKIKVIVYNVFKLNDKSLNTRIKEVFDNGINTSKIEQSKETINYKIRIILEQITNFYNDTANSILSNEEEYSYNYTLVKSRIEQDKIYLYNTLIDYLLMNLDSFKGNVVKNIYTDFYEKFSLDFSTNISSISSYLQENNLNIPINNVFDILTFTLEAANKVLIELKLDVRNTIDKEYIAKYNKLNDIFNFSNILDDIENTFDNCYNNILKPALEKKSTVEGSEYQIQGHEYLNTTINSNIDGIKQALEVLKGNDFEVKNYDKSIVHYDVAYLYINIIEDLNYLYNEFTDKQKASEEEALKEIIETQSRKSFKDLFNRIIPYFGQNFIDRTIRYNEIQKIQNLYNSLRYATVQSYLHYQNMAILYKNFSITLPKGILTKITKMNNLAEITYDNNYHIKTLLNQNTDTFIRDTGAYIIQKFISSIQTQISKIHKTAMGTTVPDLSRKFNEIKVSLESDYTKMMNEIYKTPFTNQYKDTLESNTNYLIEVLNEKKDIFISKVAKDVFTDVDDQISLEINDRLVNVKTKMNEYNAKFSNFNLQNSLFENLIFLNNFAKDVLVKFFDPITNIINECIKNRIYKMVDGKIDEVYNSINKKAFHDAVEGTNNRFKEAYENSLIALDNYGYETKYGEKLDNQIAKLNENSQNRRNLLENYEMQIEDSVNNRKVADLKLNAAIKKILILYQSANAAIKGSNLYREFNDILNIYKTRLDIDYLDSKNLILSSGTNEMRVYLLSKLTDIFNKANDYYDTTKTEFDNLKETLFSEISTIGIRLNTVVQQTYTIMGKRYTEIVNKLTNSQQDYKNTIQSKTLEPYEYIFNYDKYEIQTTLKDVYLYSKFDFKVTYKYENDLMIPSIVAKIYNVVTPKEIELLLYRVSSRCGRIGTKIIVEPINNSMNLTLTYNSDERDIRLLVEKDFYKYNYTIYDYKKEQGYERVLIEIGSNNYYYDIPLDSCDEKDSNLIKLITKGRDKKTYIEGEVYDSY